MFSGKPSRQQRSFVRMLGLLLSMTLVSCSTAAPSDALTQSASSSRLAGSPVVSPQASLDQSGAVTQIAGQTILLEVAQTAQQQEKGLMYRTTLAANRGMLFPFNPPQAVSFWMKNVSISLDIIFLRAGKVVNIAANLPSCTRNPCPVYPSELPVDQVVELRGGRAAELGLKPGDRILIQPLPLVPRQH